MICIIALVLIFIFDKNKSFTYACAGFVFLATNGFQLVPANILLAFGFFDKVVDYALIFLAYSILDGLIKNGRVNKISIIIAIYILIVFLYSFMYEKNTLKNILQAARYYLFIFSPVVFFRFGFLAVCNTFRGMFFLGVVLTVLFISQGYLGQQLIPMQSGSSDVLVKIGDGGDRYYNMPFIIPFCVFYVLFWHNFFGKFFSICFTFLFLYGVNVSQNRGILAAIVLMIIYALYKVFVFKLKDIFILFLAVFSIFLAIAGERWFDGVENLRDIFSVGLKVTDAEAYDNTVLFRLMHLQERYIFLSRDIVNLLFGVGFMSDGSPITLNMDINFGLINEVTHDFFKIDTSDIAWSVILMNFGLVGIIFAIIFLYYVFFYMASGGFNNISIGGACLLVYGVFSSFTSAELISPSYIVIVGMFFSLNNSGASNES